MSATAKNEIVADVRREIEEDAAWAESSPMPDPSKAAYNVFDNTIVPRPSGRRS